MVDPKETVSTGPQKQNLDGVVDRATLDKITNSTQKGKPATSLKRSRVEKASACTSFPHLVHQQWIYTAEAIQSL